MHDLARMGGFAAGAGDHFRGLLGAPGGAAHRGGQLVQGGGGLFQRSGLLLGAARQVVRGVGDLVGAGAQAVRRGRDDLDGFLQLGDGGVEVVLQLAIVAREVGLDAEGQVALGQVLQRLGQRRHHQGVLAGGGGGGLFLGAALVGGQGGVLFLLGAHLLEVDLVVAEDLQRADDSAQLIAPGHLLQVDRIVALRQLLGGAGDVADRLAGGHDGQEGQGGDGQQGDHRHDDRGAHRGRGFGLALGGLGGGAARGVVDDLLQLGGHLDIGVFEAAGEAHGHAGVDVDHAADRVDGAAAFVERLDQRVDLRTFRGGQLGRQALHFLAQGVELGEQLCDARSGGRRHRIGLRGQDLIERAVGLGDAARQRLDLAVDPHVLLDHLLERGRLALLDHDGPAGHQGQHQKSESRREADFDDQWQIDEPEALHRSCPLLRRAVRTDHQRSRGIITV